MGQSRIRLSRASTRGILRRDRWDACGDRRGVRIPRVRLSRDMDFAGRSSWRYRTGFENSVTWFRCDALERRRTKKADACEPVRRPARKPIPAGAMLFTFADSHWDFRRRWSTTRTATHGRRWRRARRSRDFRICGPLYDSSSDFTATIAWDDDSPTPSTASVVPDAESGFFDVFTGDAKDYSAWATYQVWSISWPAIAARWMYWTTADAKLAPSAFGDRQHSAETLTTESGTVPVPLWRLSRPASQCRSVHRLGRRHFPGASLISRGAARSP